MRILVVGYGSIGKRHIENLSKFVDLEIIVCTKRKYDNFLKKKKCKKISSLDSMKEKPHAAIICNVTSEHMKAAIKLLVEAGSSVEEAEEIYKLTSLCTFNERFVIPPAHREEAIEMTRDPLEHKQSVGFGFREEPVRGA